MSKNVKFDSPGAPRSSASHGSRRSDDSAHGHQSHQESVERLHQRLEKALASRDEWQNKARDLANTLDQIIIEKKDVEAHARALSSRIEVLESELRRTALEQKGSGTPSPPSPRMSGANPDAPKRRSSVSVYHKPRKDKEVERAEREQQREKDKLKQRFSRNDESDRSGGSSSSTKTTHSRSNSYVEAMGPGSQRPPPIYPPLMVPSRTEPFIAPQVPRNVVRYYAAEPAAAYKAQVYESGNYMAHPLPITSSSQARR